MVQRCAKYLELHGRYPPKVVSTRMGVFSGFLRYTLNLNTAHLLRPGNKHPETPTFVTSKSGAHQDLLELLLNGDFLCGKRNTANQDK